MSDENSNGDMSKMSLKVPRNGSLDEVKKILDDTRTRKTIKLKAGPAGSEAPVSGLATARVAPAVKLSVESDAEKTDSAPIVDPMSIRDTDTGGMKRLIDDTKTRKTVKLTPKVIQRPGINATDSTPISDPMSRRDTDTGDLNKLDIAQKSKTLNLNMVKTTSRPIPTEKPSDAEEIVDTKTAAVTLDTKTAAVKPIPEPVVSAANGDAARPSVLKLTPKLTPRVEPSPEAPAQGAENEVLDTKTAAVKIDTKTAAVKAPEKTQVQAVEPPDGGEDSKTVGIKRSTIGMVPVVEEKVGEKSISPFPTVAPAREVPDSAKTVRLRPSSPLPESAASEPEKASSDDTKTQASIQVAKLASTDKSAKSTIKLKPSGADGSSNTVKVKTGISDAPAPGAVTVDLKSPEELKASARTLELTPSDKAAPDAENLDMPAKAEPGAETVIESPPPIPELPKPTATGIKLPKLKAMAPEEEKTEPAKEEEPAIELSTGADKKESGGGLKLKKIDKDAEGPKGPPRIQLDQQKIELAGKSGEEKSMASVALSAVAIIALGASIFFSGSQYYELWGKALLAGKPSSVENSSVQSGAADTKSPDAKKDAPETQEKSDKTAKDSESKSDDQQQNGSGSE